MLQEGEVLQKYLIEARVTKGGMGWLYKGQHTTLKMPVAIKVLLPHHAEDPELRGRFLNEARIQCRLKHPYIVQVTDTIELDDLLGIVMEWVEGGDLMSYMQSQEELLSFHQIWSVIGPVLEALQYAHDKGVVHRDIKPDNILMQRDGELIIPKVSDFGLAKLDEGLSRNWTKEGEALGSIRYMPPEQIRNTKDVDLRADIYSLGVVLFFMATGQYPFRGTPEQLLYAHMRQTPPNPQEINDKVNFAFGDVILWCLQKDPEDRPRDCSELYQAMARVAMEYMEGTEDTARPHPHLAPTAQSIHMPQPLATPPEPKRAPLRGNKANIDATMVLRRARKEEVTSSVLGETLPPQKLHQVATPPPAPGSSRFMPAPPALTPTPSTMPAATMPPTSTSTHQQRPSPSTPLPPLSNNVIPPPPMFPQPPGSSPASSSHTLFPRSNQPPTELPHVFFSDDDDDSPTLLNQRSPLSPPPSPSTLQPPNHIKKGGLQPPPARPSWQKPPHGISSHIDDDDDQTVLNITHPKKPR